MADVASIVLVGGGLACVALYRLLPGREATLVGLIGGWLLLPVATRVPAESAFLGRQALALPGLPPTSKGMVIGLGCLAGAMLFGWRALRRLRPAWVDLPIALWCLAPLASCLANGRPAVEGLAAMRDLVVIWGVPYILGRAYLAESQGLGRLAVALVAAGLLGVPLCLGEMVAGSYLYPKIYGAHPFQATRVDRLLWTRPLLFQESVDQLGSLMGGAAVAAIWLWRGGRWPSWRPAAGAIVAGVLGSVGLLCQSLPEGLLWGAAAVGGWLAIGGRPDASKRWDMRRGPEAETLLGLFLALAMLAGVFGRAAAERGSMDHLRATVAVRGEPLARLRDRAWVDVEAVAQRPWLGTGTLDGRAHAGLWLQTAEAYGLLGLSAALATLMAPIVTSWRWLPPRSLSSPGGLAVAMAGGLVAVNVASGCFEGGWFVPLTAAAGGLAGWSMRKKKGASLGAW